MIDKDEDEGQYELEQPAEVPVPTGSGPASAPTLTPTPAPAPAEGSPPVLDRAIWTDRLAWSLTVLICLAHAALACVGSGGLAGIASDWPPSHTDHGVHFHHGLAARAMLHETGSLAGYDPSFMAGYPLSIVSDLSSTMSDAVLLASGDRPALGYKVEALACVVLSPWLIALAASTWRAKPVGVLASVALYVVYFWTDFPFKYALLGMLGYLVSVPLGLVAASGLAAFCESGGFRRWFWAALACSAVFFVHVTSPMIVGPAGLAAYLAALVRARMGRQVFPASRHAGFWAIGLVVLALNAYWWLPGLLLASTKGPSNDAFVNPEPIAGRLFEVVWIAAPPILVTAAGLAPLGLAVLAGRKPVGASALGAFIAAGFGWGYLAGAFRGLDDLQPGRHTYALYAGSCVAAGVGLGEVFARLRLRLRLPQGQGGRLDGWMAVAVLLIGFKVFGPGVDYTLRGWVLGRDKFLLVPPNPNVDRVFEQVRAHVKPGERLLFEESGVAGPDGASPFGVVHVSPLLPWKCGVEVIGGPLLHSTVTTNFTQFGEGKLFGNPNWDRDFFDRYARIYRPSAIVCWSRKARAFCRANPDLIQILEDDGSLLLGRVVGFEGPAVRGKAQVEAGPNRLVVRGAEGDPADPDGLVVLRYHYVPYLKANPSAEIVPVKLEEDPVPFIGLRPTAGPVTIEMVLPPRWGGRR